MDDATRNLVRVARALQRSRVENVVFVGGAVVTLLLADEIAQVPDPVREFIRAALGGLVRRSDLLTLVHAHLPPDDASQARAEEILLRMRRITRT